MKTFLKITGLIFMISPLFLYQFIHGDYDRYLWIINGAFPFSYLGGMSLQLLMMALLFCVGIVLVLVSYKLKNRG